MGSADGDGEANSGIIPPEIPLEIQPEISADFLRDTRWMSYRELAEVLAPTKIDSVVRLVRRKRWTKRQSNNGVRIAVPADFLADIQGKQRRGPSGQVPDVPRNKPRKQADQERAEWAERAAAVARADQERAGYIAAILEDHTQERAIWAGQMAAVRADVERLAAELNGLLVEAIELRARADRAEGIVEGLKAAHAQAQAPPTQVPPGRLVVWLRSLLRSLREEFRP